MAKVMEMPKLSDTMKEGVVAQWLVKEGDKVTAGSPIIEIETDKATMEYEAPTSGVLLKILVANGGTCALRAPIAVIGKAGEDWQQALDAFGAGAPTPAVASTSAAAPAAPKAPSSAPTQTPSAPAASATPQAAPLGASGRVKASPLARKVAKDQGIALEQLAGTGPGGRIVLRDVASASPAQAASFSTPSRAVAAPGSVNKVPLTMMRKTIAARLSESVQTAPHFYLTISIGMDAVLNWRKQVQNKLGDKAKFSVNDVIILLAAKALRKHPQINASWGGDHIAQFADVHVGMAVALPAGLVTPVIRFADTLSITDIATATKALSAKARDGALQPQDYQGGTFTISNLGMAGIESFTAIINPPQAAILAVGATVPTPVVNATGQVVVEQRMTVTLSCDHRVIDGYQGALFLQTLKECFEDPFSAMML
jgi:pyruvate dehydrogenase E2 component (dihydrolipoamide acetyltransferase)